MNPRAAIFDVYSTLLEVRPPTEAATRWKRLFEEALGKLPPLSRTEFSLATSREVARRHAEARARGIRWPEVLWPEVVLAVIPDLARLSQRKREDFFFQLMAVGRTLRLAEGAAECLRWLHREGVVLGIASNSQAYTLKELAAALEDEALNLSIFDSTIRFWSFENGFSKPDPHVFHILMTRLKLQGIQPGETLFVGDRLDNDIEPARVHGFQTWHLSARANAHSGSWRELLMRLKKRA